MISALRLTSLPAALGLLALTSCQLPPDAVPNPAGDVTVKRAESANGAPLSTGADQLNVPRRAADINAMARKLAGMNDSSAPARHLQQMDLLWRAHELRRGAAARRWAAAEIGDLQRQGTLFYPFSGPDYLFAQELFPSAQTYILCGLESAEPLPQLATLSQAEIDSGLATLCTTLHTSMAAGYFITQDMRQNLQTTRFRGVLPVLLTVLARTGSTVESIDVVQLDGAGNPVLAQLSGGTAPGIMIRFRNGFGGAKRLFYFRQDLSNGSTRPGGPFLTFVAKQGNPPALVKSASYLMHGDSFSHIRDFLLSNCSGIVQDPSGVPYRTLVQAGLRLSLYGNYESTLPIFSQQQPDLAAAYRSGAHPVKTVDFGFGYLYAPRTTSIIVARRG